MSKLEMINTEIDRRYKLNEDLSLAEKDLLAAQEQLNKLDEMYRDDEKKSRDYLNSVYLETRYYTGNWPVVFSKNEVEEHPFFNGSTDVLCNPYFPVSKVKDGSSDGVSPFYLAPDYDGDRPRKRVFSKEPDLRAIAIAALAAYPDRSQEIGVGSCSNPSYSSESSCENNGGTWSVAYPPNVTATYKLRTALNNWKGAVEGILANLYQDTGNVEQAFWQDILSKINTILPHVSSDPVYPAISPDFASGSIPDVARDYLVSNSANIQSHVDARSNLLISGTNTEEKVFFSVLKLRLHQVNGSFSKVKNIKKQILSNRSIIKDNISSIASLNVIKVKNS